MRIRWARRAADQLLEAVSYLENERVGTGRSLHDAVRGALELARDHPRLFPVVPGAGGEPRRTLLRRWGYWLIFEVDDDDAAIVVLSIWHCRRAPEGWSDE